MYKTELHCHSSEVSCCARADAATLARRYKEAGYRTVVLTNHFSSFTYGHLKCSDWQEWITRFVDGYQRLREAAPPDLTVLFGAELRLNNNPNDFLMFGVTEEFLRAHPDIFDMWIEDLHPLALENGIFISQAHPFRNHCRITPPDWIDAIEIFNGSAGGHYATDSRNDVAAYWAKRHNMAVTSGTDYHFPNDTVNGGICTEEPILTLDDLTRVLRSGDYRLIIDGE